MSDERRKQGRVPTVIDLVWEGAAAKYEARTSDLNTEGCFIDHISNVTIGEIITFNSVCRLKIGLNFSRK